MIFTLNAANLPMMPCKPARARILLKKKKAIVVKLQPFTIKLLNVTNFKMQPVALKIDPGLTSGLCPGFFASSTKLLYSFEVKHRVREIVAGASFVGEEKNN